MNSNRWHAMKTAGAHLRSRFAEFFQRMYVRDGRDSILVIFSAVSATAFTWTLITSLKIRGGPVNWLWLSLSGFFWLTLALFLGSGIRVAHVELLRVLKERGALLKHVDIQSCIADLDRIANRVGVTMLFLLPLIFTLGLYSFHRSFNELVWAWAVIGLVFGYPTGRTIGLISGNLRWTLKNIAPANVKLIPGHFDGAGGLKPLGDLLLACSNVAFVALCHVGISSVVFPLWRLNDYSEWRIVYGILLGVAVGMLVPSALIAFKTHWLLRGEKARLSAKVNVLICRISELQARLHANDSISTSRRLDEVSEEALEDQIDLLTTKCRQLQDFPVWPTDATTMRRIKTRVIAVGSPLLVGFLKAIGVLEALQAGIGIKD